MRNFDGITRVKIQLAKPVVKKTIAWASIAGLVLSVFAFTAPYGVRADSVGLITFEPSTYAVGDINGQDGWIKTGPYDAAVTATGIPLSFGTQSLRISDAVTSGSFGDQTFAKPLTDSAGETAATNGTFSAGTKQPHFEMQFDIASAVPGAQQPGMHLSVSPDRGDGSRMSYLRFEDQADGIHVFFDDVQGVNPGLQTSNFVETDIATISRAPHTIKLTMDLLDGPSNDVVKVYIDGVLKITGTSWENYFRYDTEAAPENSPRIIKTVEFRESATANPLDAGKGFLIDNLSLSSGPVPTPPGQNCTEITLVSGTSTQFVGLTTTDPAGSSSDSSFPLGTPGAAVVVTPTGYPGAWDAASANPDVTGASWVSNDAVQPTNPPGPNPGQDGTKDAWRLFSDSFTIPAAATSISSPVLHFTADNSVQAFLDGVSVGTAPGFSTVAASAPLILTTGAHTFKFVAKNDAFAGSFNPTGLLYKVVIDYCAPVGTVSTNLTQDTSGGNAPIVKAKWEAYGADNHGHGTAYASATEYYRDEDTTTPGAQFLPSGQYGVNTKIALCSVVTDPDGLADITTYPGAVYGDVFYPTGIALGSSHKTIDNQSGLGCGGLMQEDQLTKLSKADGLTLFCNNVRNNNNNLVTFNGTQYTYDEICKADGELQKETAAVYCTTKNISYEDPAGDYQVWSVAQDKVGLQGKLINSFNYIPVTAFEPDFSNIQYGSVRLATEKIVSGDLSFGTGSATVRNVGNTRLSMQVTQDDMGFGMTNGNYNVGYKARVGSGAAWASYAPNASPTTLADPLDLSQINEMDFSLTASKFPPTHTGTSYTGNMILGATQALQLTCTDPPKGP